ncbi:MAG: glycosyltransferase family 4 protein [Candidatus Hydrogenedentes bacterium]|nr:glycosyltransferase family 4 protein [Candidatus Hydrogenedentota bacterium]
MRIGIDAHAIGTRAGGNETYMRELLHSLREHGGDGEYVALVNRGLDPGMAGELECRELPHVPAALRVPLVLPWVASRARLNLLHTQYITPPYCPCPCVVSVHDIGWVKHPELFPPLMRTRMELLMPGTVRRAARIFVLTEAIKREIVDTYNVSPDRIDTVSPAVAPRFFVPPEQAHIDTVRCKYDLPEPFVLYMGALQPRKNVARLATAVAHLRERGLPHALVIAGERTWMYGETLAAIESLRLGDRLVFTGYVDGTDLPALIRAADAFAYVSLYEGFGLPALEALACGVPVLASTDPAIQEVVADAAHTCDPFDVDAITDGLARILEDHDYTSRLKAAGPRRASAFTREAMAAAAMSGYRKALGKN